MSQPPNSRSRRGAVGLKVSFLGRCFALIGHHAHTFQDSLSRLLKEPLQIILTSSVIAIALSLPATLYLVVDNVRQFESSFESFSQITAYLDNGASPSQIAEVKNQLSIMPEVASVIYISPAQGLQAFIESSGFGSALEHLELNPLPPVFIIEPKLAAPLEADQAQQLALKIKQIDDVDDTQIDMLWLQRLNRLTQIGQKIVFALGSALGLGVLVIIGNSIRLAIHNRREEIVVVKLVGGTDAYVRRPFLYSGMLVGLMGAVGASLIMVIGFWWLGSSVAELSELYGSQYRLLGPGIKGCIVLIAIGAVLGLSGSWLAVGKHLKAIKPR